MTKEHQQSLEPCPFCGGEADFGERSYRTPRGSGVQHAFTVHCVSAKCVATLAGLEGFDNKDEAIAAWNTRALTPPDTGWRPISEAPKDRGAILGFMRIGDGNVTRVLHWDDEDAEWHSEGNHYDPTHFMPLPAPPTGDEE